MIDVKIEWIEDIIHEFGAIKVQEAIDRGIKKSIFQIERTAKINTPVVTWLLRNSYETTFGFLTGTLRNYREYAPYVEARRWFMERTLLEEENNVFEIIDKEIESLVDDIK